MEQMTENETKKGDLYKDDNGADLQQSSETEEEPRRSQRTRKLTEKAQELHDNKSKKLQDRFTITYDKWKVTAKQAKKVIKSAPSIEAVQELMSKISCASADVKHSYEELHKGAPPSSEIRHRADTCDAVSKIILENASTYLYNKDNEDVQTEDFVWPESGSMFSFSASQGTSKGSQKSLSSASGSSINSRQSSLSSVRRQEAAAELAATQAALKVLQQIGSEQQELENTEEENRKKLALQEEENVTRKKVLEEKRRQIERREQEASSDEEIAELLLSNINLQELKEILTSILRRTQQTV